MGALICRLLSARLSPPPGIERPLEQGGGYFFRRPVPEYRAKRRGHLRAVLAGGATNQLPGHPREPIRERSHSVGPPKTCGDRFHPVAGVATIGEIVDRNAARHRFNMILLIWFACVRRCSGNRSLQCDRGGDGGTRARDRYQKPGAGHDIPHAGAGLDRRIARRRYRMRPRQTRLRIALWNFGARSAGLRLGFGFPVSRFLVFRFWPAWSAAGGDPKSVLRAS